MRATTTLMMLPGMALSLVACATGGDEQSRTASPIDVRHSAGFCPVTNVTGGVPGAEEIVAVSIFPLEPDSPDVRAASSRCTEEDGTPVGCPNFDVGLVEADQELDEFFGNGELDERAAGTITTRDFKLDGSGGMILLDTTGTLETDGIAGTFEVLYPHGSLVASTVYEFGNCEWTKLGLDQFEEYVLAVDVAAPGDPQPELRQNTWFHIDSSIWSKLADFSYECRVAVEGTSYEARLSLDQQFVYELRAVDVATGSVLATQSSVVGAMVEIDDALTLTAGGRDARLLATSLARWDARTPPTKRDGDLPEQFARLDRVPDDVRAVGALTCETVPRLHLSKSGTLNEPARTRLPAASAASFAGPRPF